MGTIELILLSVGLAMDAFAVAICKGLNMRKMNYKNALILALFFGGFQALMPAIGYKKETKASVVKKKLLGLFFVPEFFSQ